MNKKEKDKFIDDGHTIYNMDIDGMPKRSSNKGTGIELTRKERRALIIAAFLHFIPILIGIVLCFILTMLIIYFWLR